MKQPTLTVFSEYVHMPGPVTVYSALQHMEHLVEMQPLALQVVVDFSASVSGSLEAHIEHAGDGMYFLQKNTASEIPTITFGAVTTINHLVAAGAEKFGVAPSHEYVRIAVTLSTNIACVAHLDVYATGHKQVNRVRPTVSPGDEALTDHLRDRLPTDVADQVEAFRRRARMSDETLGELQRLWDGSDTSDDDASRAEHVGFFLSGRAKREVAKFQSALKTLPPHVVPALKRGIMRAALDELGRPEWDFDEG